MYVFYFVADSNRSNVKFMSIILTIGISMGCLGLLGPYVMLYMEIDPLYYIIKPMVIDPFIKKYAKTYGRKVVLEAIVNISRCLYLTIGIWEVARLTTAIFIFPLLVLRSTFFCLTNISENISISNSLTLRQYHGSKAEIIVSQPKKLFTSQILSGFIDYQSLKISLKMSSYLPEAAVLFSTAGGSIIFLLAIIVTISFYNKIPFTTFVMFPCATLVGFLFSSGGLRQSSNCYECSLTIKESWKNHFSYFNSTTLAGRMYWKRRYQSLRPLCFAAGVSDTIFYFMQRSTCSRFYYEIFYYAISAILSLREMN